MTEDLGDEKSNLNNETTHINRGFELLLRNRRRKPEPPKTFQVKFGKMVSLFRREIVFHLNFYLDIRKKQSLEDEKMLAVTLTIGTLVSIMMFFVGGVVGWLAKDHVYQTQPVYTHPEMFDENGNILPDEILAVRFENGYDELDEEDDN